MNTIDFSHTGGFPLETNTLDFLQKSFVDPIKALTALGGDNYILSGVIETDGKVSDGWVVINGEILPFKGGFKQSSVIVTKTAKKANFENNTEHDVYFTRRAMFGVGLESIPFASMARISDLQQLKEDWIKRTGEVEQHTNKRTGELQSAHDTHKEYATKRIGELQSAHDTHKEYATKRIGELQSAHDTHKEYVTKRTGELQSAHETHKEYATKRIGELQSAHETLKDQFSNLKTKQEIIPGMIMAWKGSTDMIPAGWKLCKELKDKFILGAGTDFKVGDTGGTRTHQLTIEEMPTHDHIEGSGGRRNDYSGGTSTHEQLSDNLGSANYKNQNTSKTGGGKAHNNMPPYYVLAYIEYVG